MDLKLTKKRFLLSIKDFKTRDCQLKSWYLGHDESCLIL